jgi:HlyD family secretion protein
MDVKINRLDPNVPDPVESRRRAAGRFVRIAYATIVFGVLAFFIIYFGAPFVYLRGPGVVTSPRYVVSLPFTVQVNQMKLVPGATVQAGQEIAEVLSPEQDSIVATYMRALADISGRTAELRIKARVAQESLEAARSYLRVTEEAAERIEAMATATVTFRMEVLRERASARKAVVSQEAEVAESAVQLASLDDFIQQLRNRLGEVEAHFRGGRVSAPIAGIVSTGLAHVGQSLGGGHSDRRNPRSDRCLRGLVYSQCASVRTGGRARSPGAVRQPPPFRKDRPNPAGFRCVRGHAAVAAVGA